MASHTTKSAVLKHSFASVAAMAPPAPNGQLNTRKENKKPSPDSSPTRSNLVHTVDSPSAQQLHQQLQSSMSRLAVKDPHSALKPLNDQQKSNISRAGLRFDDEQTQMSSSSTKPASLDGKSTTSGTTFGLDEKESLRPDDSASVKAAEDDEFASGPASGAYNSRVGSEAGSRAFRDQFYEITENISSASHRAHASGRRIISGIEEEGPKSTNSPLTPSLPAPVTIVPPQPVPTNGPSIDYNYQEPDERLFEALGSPKDRLFLLRLEQEVITFVRDPTEPPLIELPPCNSFCRLLAHKLADYYALTHFVDNAQSTVRLYRTPFCRLPTPLSALAAAAAQVDAAPSSQPAMKIMRRAGLSKDGQVTGSPATTAEGSMAPSKAGSETGYDSQQGTGMASPTDSTTAKDKSAMTREEREAKYKETRERIFGPENENAEPSEVVNGISRTSSRNEKKKKKHKNNDDGFTARSQYNAYYPNIPYAPTTYEPAAESAMYYSPYAMPANVALPHSGMMGTAPLQQGYQQAFQPIANSQPFLTTMGGNFMGPWHDAQNGTSYNQPLPQQYYPQMQSGMFVNEQSPILSSPALSSSGQFPRPQSQISEQQWPQPNHPYSYQSSRDQPQYFPPQINHQSSIPSVQSVPYQYGQLPVQPGIQGPKAQHPLPGSYKSQTFNPQTRAFVPNSGPFHPQLIHQGNTPNNATSRSPAASFQNANQFPVLGQQPAYYSQVGSVPVAPLYNSNPESKTNGVRKSSAQSNVSPSPIQSSLSKWGTPSHLPPKPPPPETPSVPEGQHSLPLNNQFNVNVQAINGGQPMPNFQNGVYSMPNANPRTT